MKERVLLGSLINKARKDKGWSLRKLSEETGITIQTLVAITQGKYSVGIDNYLKVIKALDIVVEISSEGVNVYRRKQNK